MSEIWKSHESEFTAKFGGGKSNESRKERSSFEGEY